MNNDKQSNFFTQTNYRKFWSIMPTATSVINEHISASVRISSLTLVA